MGIIKSIFLSILALLLVFDLTTYVLLSSVKDNVFSTQFYTGILDRNNGYAKFQGILIDSMSNMQTLPEGITADDVKDIVRQSVTVPYMKNQTEKLIKGMVTYFNTDAVKPDLTISVKEVKAKVVAAFMNTTMKKMLPTTTQNESLNQSAVEAMFNISVPGKCSGMECIAYCQLNQADCENITISSELISFMAKCGSPEECMAYCQNPTNSADPGCAAVTAVISSSEGQALISAQIESQLSAQLPDTIDVYQTLFGSPQTKVQLENAKSYYKQFSLILTIILVFAIATIGIMALVVRDISGICRTVSVPLAVSGISLVAVALFVPAIAMKMFPEEMLASLGAANAVFVQNLVNDALRTLFSPALTNGAILAVIGVVMLIVSLFIKPKDGQKAETAKETKKKK